MEHTHCLHCNTWFHHKRVPGWTCCSPGGWTEEAVNHRHIAVPWKPSVTQSTAEFQRHQAGQHRPSGTDSRTATAAHSQNIGSLTNTVLRALWLGRGSVHRWFWYIYICIYSTLSHCPLFLSFFICGMLSGNAGAVLNCSNSSIKIKLWRKKERNTEQTEEFSFSSHATEFQWKVAMHFAHIIQYMLEQW